MKNKRGKTVNERIKEEIEYAQNISNAEHREILALKALGAADMAVEYGLITYKEWETHIDTIFKLM